jgi:valyl-tRNA synthetase
LLLGAIDKDAEKVRLGKEEELLQKLINIQEYKLANDEFINKAPEKIVKQEKEKLEKYQIELYKINKALTNL